MQATTRKNSVSLSVIITTYNRSNALRLILESLENQTDKDFEVIVADDGSTSETGEAIAQLQKIMPYSLRHYWQPDQGFRAAKARNQAAVKSNGTYLIFLDGDCVPSTTFIARHRKLAETGFFVVGNRLLLSKTYTEQVLDQQLAIYNWTFYQWLKLRAQKACNRILPVIYFPFYSVCKHNSKRWQGAKTCNLAIWKTDFLNVNGFEEAYEGWGYEDSDLVIRLIRTGVLRKNGHFSVPVFHLWHPENDRSTTPENLERLKQIQNSTEIRAKCGVEEKE
jgi:glycosyltransferase involved in cell wall biosynthesis